MPDRRTTHATASFVGTLFVALFVIFGLVSCGGGGGGGGNNVTGNNLTGNVVSAPAAPAITLLTASLSPGGTPISQPIPYNSKPWIEWTSTNASRCFLNYPNQSVTPTGTANSWLSPDGLIADTTYTLSCENSVGAKTMWVVTVPVTPAPTITYIVATPSTITSGQTTAITWASANSTSCILTATGLSDGITGGVGSTIGLSGSFTTPALTSDQTYTVTCSVSGIVPAPPPASQSAKVTVAQAGVTLPTVALSVPLLPIPYNTSATLSWTSNAASCALTSPTGASTANSGTGFSGSFNTGPLTANATYIVTCNNAAGPASDTKIISVGSAPPVPVVTVSAAPSQIASGGTSTITWTSTGSTSCSSPGGGGTGTSGTFTTPALIVPTTYTVTCTGPGGTASGNATVTIGAVAACPAVNVVGGAVNPAIILPDPALVPARLIGVAPLSVFFDATGTAATTTIKPFHELEYRWDFGDPASGTWAKGAQPGVSSKNSATGPVAAHVYETPGTYTATLVVTDGTNTVTYNNACAPQLAITVQNPNLVFSGANTICIGATAIPTATDCPGDDAAEIRVMQPDFAAAVNTYAKTGKRVLFKRGDTFFSTPYTIGGVPTGAGITATGPGIIGAFGAGARPVVRPSEANGNLLLGISDRTSPNLKDWRVMDLELDGMSTGSGSRIYSSGVGFGGGANQITLLRLHIHDTYATGIGNATNTLDHYNNAGYPGHKMWDQIAVVDSSVLKNHGDGSGNGGCGMYFASLRFSLLGTTVDDVTQAEHVLRFPYLDKAVLSNNTLSRQAANKLVIKLLAPTWNWACGPGGAVQTCQKPVGDANDPDIILYGGVNSAVYDPAIGASGYTEHIVISDNKIINGPTAAWAIVVGPKNVAGDERVRDVIAERNWFVGAASSSGQSMFIVLDSVKETTARNNICDMTAATGAVSCFTAGKGGNPSVGPPPDHFRIFNNTAYSASTGFKFLELQLFTGNPADIATNVTLQNNLAYAPSAPNNAWLAQCGFGTPPCPTLSNNSTDSQIRTTSPRFAVTPPAAPADYTPASAPVASYAIGTGALVPVWSDFFRNDRPQSGVPGIIDMGAIEVP